MESNKELKVGSPIRHDDEFKIPTIYSEKPEIRIQTSI